MQYDDFKLPNMNEIENMAKEYSRSLKNLKIHDNEKIIEESKKYEIIKSLNYLSQLYNYIHMRLRNIKQKEIFYRTKKNTLEDYNKFVKISTLTIEENEKQNKITLNYINSVLSAIQTEIQLIEKIAELSKDDEYREILFSRWETLKTLIAILK